MNPHMANRLTIANELLSALDEYIAACTVAIASIEPKTAHGSGVAVRYNGKQYILTAAHVLDPEPDNQKLKFLGKAGMPLQMLATKNDLEKAIATGTPKPTSSTAPQIDIRRRITHKRDDIAALEVERLLEALPHTSLHDLSAQEIPQTAPGQTITIHGFPGELAKRYERERAGNRGWALFPHITMQIVQDISAAPKLKDPGTHFITDYDYSSLERCDPHGMSGCGGWSIPSVKRNELWSANRTQLLGIQVAYDRQAKVLVFVKVDRALRLLSGNQ